MLQPFLFELALSSASMPWACHAPSRRSAKRKAATRIAPQPSIITSGKEKGAPHGHALA
jgi:hypothetical protein